MTDLIWYNYAVYKYACHSLLVKFMFPWQRCKRDDQKIIESDIIKQIKSRRWSLLHVSLINLYPYSLNFFKKCQNEKKEIKQF